MVANFNNLKYKVWYKFVTCKYNKKINKQEKNKKYFRFLVSPESFRGQVSGFRFQVASCWLLVAGLLLVRPLRTRRTHKAVVRRVSGGARDL